MVQERMMTAIGSAYGQTRSGKVMEVRGHWSHLEDAPAQNSSYEGLLKGVTEAVVHPEGFVGVRVWS